ASIGLLGSGQGNRLAARGGDEPDVGGGVRRGGNLRSWLPVIGAWPSGTNGDPFPVGRKQGRPSVRFSLLQWPNIVRRTFGDPEREAFFEGIRVNPAADVGEPLLVGSEHGAARPLEKVEVIDREQLLLG